MTLHINEAEVRSIFSMALALEMIEEVSRKQAAGEVIVHPRRRFELPHGGFFHYMAAADFASGYVAMKQYTYVRGKLSFLVPLYEIASGDLVALIEADYLGQVRTGAASGVATKHLARKNARTTAIIGTGGQARTQLEAVAAVRKLDVVRVFGRDPQRRAAFAKEMGARLGLAVKAVASSAEAVRGADIVCTATTSSNAVVHGAEISFGAHINAIGANHAHKRELDDEAIAKADVVFVDSLEQSRQEAGDLILGFQGDVSRWARVHELGDLVAGKCPGRSHDSQITLFKSNGIAAWDLASAVKVFTLAKEKNLGRPLPLWQPPV
jgi:ornithine cyclodeaminase/alanine dehydrogenase-like protein (mu-crystallin family)